MTPKISRHTSPCLRTAFLFAVAVLCLLPYEAQGAKVSFQGNSLKAQEVKPEANTGLNAIFVLYDTEGVSATFFDSGATAQNTKWYRYSNLGGGYAEEIPGIVFSGSESTLNDLAGDMGYIVEYGTSRYYFWVVNYLPHRLKLSSLEPAPDQSCENTVLNLKFGGSPIHFFTINGQQKTLDQQIELSYYNLVWNEEGKQFDQVEKTMNLESPVEHITIYPPVTCQTAFHLSGDRFLKSWNWGEEVESDTFQPVAVDARTEAVQAEDTGSPSKPEAMDKKRRKTQGGKIRSRDGETDPGSDFAEGEETGENGEGTADEEEEYRSNIMHSETTGLGGSAPCEITFYAYTTDAVLHHEWQMSSDPSFEDITYRFNEQDLTYTFLDEGTVYLRYIGSNADGSCEVVCDTYSVTIGASDLWCPNAFSPGASPGVNDVWKVAYRSLVEFKCWIFDRYGTEMCYFDNPQDGWDGKYRGKLVKPGVYYYVIEALGADGKKYKKSGDINIVGFKLHENTSGASTEM